MSAAHIALGRARVWLNWIDKDRLTALSALAALIVWISPNPFPATVQADLETRERARPAAPATSPASERATRREHRVGGYGGVSYTLPSAVVIQKPGSYSEGSRHFLEPQTSRGTPEQDEDLTLRGRETCWRRTAPGFRLQRQADLGEPRAHSLGN